jgi:hypothetical protein
MNHTGKDLRRRSTTITHKSKKQPPPHRKSRNRGTQNIKTKPPPHTSRKNNNERNRKRKRKRGNTGKELWRRSETQPPPPHTSRGKTRSITNRNTETVTTPKEKKCAVMKHDHHHTGTE